MCSWRLSWTFISAEEAGKLRAKVHARKPPFLSSFVWQEKIGTFSVTSCILVVGILSTECPSSALQLLRGVSLLFSLNSVGHILISTWKVQSCCFCLIKILRNQTRVVRGGAVGIIVNRIKEKIWGRWEPFLQGRIVGARRKILYTDRALRCGITAMGIHSIHTTMKMWILPEFHHMHLRHLQYHPIHHHHHLQYHRTHQHLQCPSGPTMRLRSLLGFKAVIIGRSLIGGIRELQITTDPWKRWEEWVPFLYPILFIDKVRVVAAKIEWGLGRSRSSCLLTIISCLPSAQRFNKLD